MRLFTSLIATAAIVFSASAAFASATWTVTASTGDGSDLNAVTPGTTIILDISLTTSAPGELLGISGSVNDYDSSVVAFASAPVLSTAILNSNCFPSFGCFGGVANLEAGVRSEVGVEGAGNEDTFVSLLSVTPAEGDGTIDDPNPQFQLVYNVVGNPGDTTVLRVGTYTDYADAFSGVSDSNVTNQEISITIVPEPGTALLMGLGLAGLAAAGRRE